VRRADQEFNCFLGKRLFLSGSRANTYSANDCGYPLVGLIWLVSPKNALCNHAYERVAMPFQFFGRESTREGHLRVNVRMTCEARDNQVVVFVGAALASWHNVVNLQFRRKKTPADAATPATVHHHPVNRVLRYLFHSATSARACSCCPAPGTQGLFRNLSCVS
jgi:hypothetical protein